MKSILVGALLAFAWLAQPATAQDSAPDYGEDSNWLCLPDRIDACASDQSVAVVGPDGFEAVEPLVQDADRPFDCFYVYPTVSLDPTPNSDMVAGQEELRVAHAQAARFRQHCRVFAPLYRQVTLTALRSLMAGGTMQADRAMAFGDVLASWKHYLANDNDGRGVVLIGHSQGSGMLRELLDRMDNPAERALVISAMLIGTNVERSPDGSEGNFPWMPVCTSADQAGCLVSYVTFRDTVPPPANTRFGRTQTPDREVVCVDPAGLMGGDSADAIFSTAGVGSSSQVVTEWAQGEPLPTTLFTSVPGLVQTRCISEGGASYLQVSVAADPDDARVDDIPGDVLAAGNRLDDWGLHLVDMPVVMGDLVALTARQYAAWEAEQE